MTSHKSEGGHAGWHQQCGVRCMAPDVPLRDDVVRARGTMRCKEGVGMVAANLFGLIVY